MIAEMSLLTNELRPRHHSMASQLRVRRHNMTRSVRSRQFDFRRTGPRVLAYSVGRVPPCERRAMLTLHFGSRRAGYSEL